MSTTIFATKLYAPPPRPKIVLRPQLIERLNEGLSSGRKLTLISAPAGFGKTTLVSEWALGFAYQLQGGRAAARQVYTEAIRQASGNTYYTVLATTSLGKLQESEN